jgi:diaminopimelate decarboxylase
VNGVPKNRDHIENSIKQGVRITIDGMEEFDVIESAARDLKTKAKVRLRMKPAIKGFTQYSNFVPSGPLSTDIAALAYKGGLPREAVIYFGKRIQRSPHVELVGFHEHHGRHHASLKYWEEQMKAFAEEISIVSQALDGYQAGEIDIGGGFACPRDPFGSEIKYSEPYEFLLLYGLSRALSRLPKVRYKLLSKIVEKAMVFIPNQKMAPTIEDYGMTCTRTLSGELKRLGIKTKGLMLQVEPGRSLHGDTAIHLTTVKSIKKMNAPIKWNHAALDTTEFWFTGGRYEHHVFDYIFANKTNSPLVDQMDVVGRSCYGDRIFPMIRVPGDLAPGDVMAILDVGAYQEVSMSNFNAMPRPATLLVSGDKVSIIRRPESQEDVFRRDFIPEHLKDMEKVIESDSLKGVA